MGSIGSLGSVSYDIVANDKTGEGTGKAKQTFVTTLGDIKGAISSIDQPIQGLAKNYAELDSYTAQAAISTGLSADSLQGLIKELYSVDTPLDEAGKLIIELGRAGLHTESDLRKVGTACDTLGDGIGVPADQLANMLIPAMSAFGETATDIPGKVDSIAYTLTNSQVNFSEWQRMIVTIGPDLHKMGLSIDDVNAVMMILKDRGIQGKDMLQELKKGMDDSADANKDGKISIDEYYKALGITNTELDAHKKELFDATGHAEKMADAVNKIYTPTENATQAINELALGLGPLPSDISAVTGPLGIVSDGLLTLAALKTLGLGGILTGIGTSLSTLGTGGLLASVGLGLVVPILIGIGLGLAAVWALNELGVLDFFYDLGDAFGEAVIQAGADFSAWLQGLPGEVEDMYNGVVSWFMAIPGSIGDALSGIPGALAGAFTDITTAFGALGTSVQEAFGNLFYGIGEFIGGLAQGFISAGYNIIMYIVQGMQSATSGITDAIGNIFGFLADFIPHSPAKTGPLAELPNFSAYFVDPLLATIPAVQAASSQVAAAAVMPVAQPAAVSTNTSTVSDDHSVSIGNVNASKDYSITDIMAEIATMQALKRAQRGIPG